MKITRQWKSTVLLIWKVFLAFNPNMTWENVQLSVIIFTFTVINCAWVAFFASEPIHVNAALASRYPQYVGTDERTLLSYLLRIVHSSWSTRGQISRLFHIQSGKGQYDEIWWAFFEIEESIDSGRPHISNSFNGRGTESNKTGEWISWVPAKRTTES